MFSHTFLQLAKEAIMASLVNRTEMDHEESHRWWGSYLQIDETAIEVGGTQSCPQFLCTFDAEAGSQRI